MKHVIEGTVFDTLLCPQAGSPDDDACRIIVIYYSTPTNDQDGYFDLNNVIDIPIDYNSPITENEVANLIGKKYELL